MRLRWWRGSEPVDPHHGRDPSGRLHDGDRVRPEGWNGWADLLDGCSTASDGQVSRDDHTRLLPIVTRGQRMRGEGGGGRWS